MQVHIGGMPGYEGHLNERVLTIAERLRDWGTKRIWPANGTWAKVTNGRRLRGALSDRLPCWMGARVTTRIRSVA